MSLFSGIGNFLGNIFGGNDEEKKKKQQQQSAPQRTAARPSVQSPNFNSNSVYGSIAVPGEKPSNSVNLVIPGTQPLQKAPVLGKPVTQPAPAPAEDLNKKRDALRQAQFESQLAEVKSKQYRQDMPAKIINTVTAGLGRGTIGIAQDTSGLVDLLTPGRGTSDFTKRMALRGKLWDEKAKAAGINKVAYTAAQVPINIAAFEAPGKFIKGAGIADKGLELASKVPGAARAVEAGKYLDKAAEEASGLKKVASKLAGSYVNPETVANVSGDILQNSGQRTSRNQDNSAQSLATDTAVSLGTQGALNLAGQTIKSVLNKIIGGHDSVAPGIKSVNPTREADIAQHEATQAKKVAKQAEIDQLSQQAEAERLAKSKETPTPTLREDTTPAYQRATPNTVGGAAAQHEMGVHNVPDSTFSADARINPDVSPSAVDNALQVPAYLRRNNPEELVKAANLKVAALDQRAEDIRKLTSPAKQFKDKQAVADAFQHSPEKGRATRALQKAQAENIDPEEALRATLIERQAAFNEARAAEEAVAANKVLETPAGEVPRAIRPDSGEVPVQTSGEAAPPPQVAPQTVTPEQQIDAVAPLADGERYTTTNADIGFGSDSSGGTVSYKPDGAGTQAKQVSYNQLSDKTRTELVTAENNYAKARANSKGPVEAGTRGEVQIAREQLDIAQSNAIEELGLQDYANKVDSSGNVIQKTYNDRYTDWAEAKYKSLNPDEREIFAKDAKANPEKYKAQFEAESRSTNQVAPDGQLPQIPHNPAQEVAPAAPLSHDVIVKQLGPEHQSLKGKWSERDVINLDDLRTQAEGVIAKMDDKTLLDTFSAVPKEKMVTDPNSLAVARAALDRFSQMPENDIAKRLVTDIFDAMDNSKSKSAQIMRVAQEEFDKMPISMKTNYLIKKIDAANRQVDGYEALAADPAKKAVVEATVKGHLEGSQAIAENVSGIEVQLQDAIDSISRGNDPGIDIKGLKKELQDARTKLQINNGELVKYYEKLVPGSTRAQKALSDFPRTMMLSTLTGRVNDLITTASNVSQNTVSSALQGVMAKVVNKFSPGKVSDGSLGMSKLFTGGARELKKTVGEVKGNDYVSDIQGAIRHDKIATRSGLQKARGAYGRTVQAATEAATNASAGVREQKLYQLAHQEAEKLGVPKNLRRQYAEARSAVPTRKMLDTAETLHKEMNNLNDNPVTKTLNRVAAGIKGDSAIGGLIKNQVIPFTSWLGGNIYNSITDKNVVASAVKFGDSLLKHDAEGITRNASKLITGAAEAYGIGYLLSKNGVITDKNAEGYQDNGPYFHVGDRYLSIGLAGFFAPNLVLGHAAYNGMNAEDESPTSAIAKAIGNYAWNSLAFGNALGVENNLAKAYNAGNRPGSDATDGLATAAGGVVNQFIPGFTGDINAVLDNGLKIAGKTIIPDSLNPTHEKADTKAIDPNSKSGKAKDTPKSVLNSVINRIPFASQQLPRKAGVAAKDLFDRVTKGDRETDTSKLAKVDAKKEVDRAKDFAARDIPDYKADYPKGESFDKAVQARFESGEYDKAIEGLQSELDSKKNNKNIPRSSLKDVEDNITLYKVHKNGKFEPKLTEDYKSTSVEEWRNMGNPKSDTYNPEMYQRLYDYDTARANAKISGSKLSPDKNKYTAKKASSGRGGGGGRGGGSSSTKSNTIGNTPTLSKISLGDLRPEKAGSKPMPTIQQIKAGDLIKKRTIKVSKA